MTAFNSISIIGKYLNLSALQMMQTDLADLARHLASKNITVWVEEHTAIGAELNGFNTAKLEDIGAKADLAIVMGGDGTMLSVARNLMDAGIPLVGINRGRFGFLTDLRAEDMLDAIDAILAGAYPIETRKMITTSVLRECKTVYY
jgi:NAD+ kinase